MTNTINIEPTTFTRWGNFNAKIIDEGDISKWIYQDQQEEPPLLVDTNKKGFQPMKGMGNIVKFGLGLDQQGMHEPIIPKKCINNIDLNYTSRKSVTPLVKDNLIEGDEASSWLKTSNLKTSMTPHFASLTYLNMPPFS